MMRQPVIDVQDHVCIPCSRLEPCAEEEVEYNGVTMAKGWPEQIVAAQKRKTIRIRGTRKLRVRYGSEQNWDHDFTTPCPDCAVIHGQLHVPDCDSEQCPGCLGQLISCGCTDE